MNYYKLEIAIDTEFYELVINQKSYKRIIDDINDPSKMFLDFVDEDDVNYIFNKNNINSIVLS